MGNSAYDVLGPQWGLGMPIAWFDLAAVDALVEATRHIELDQLFIGWDGEELSAWETIRTILTSHGFFFGTSGTGLITFAELRMADIRDAATAVEVTPIPLDISQHPAEGEGIDQIRGVVGELPWAQGTPFTASVLGQDGEVMTSVMRGAVFDSRTADLNFPARAPGGLLEDLATMAATRAYGAPQFTIRVRDVGFAHGEFVRVADPGTTEPYFRDLDGVPVRATDVARWYGMVVGKAPESRPGVTGLTVLMTNFLVEDWVRLRAPAAQCTGANTGASYPVGLSFNLLELDDAAWFEVGQPVELWRPDGVRRSGTSGAHDIQIIDSITANTLVMDGAFTTAAQAGDIIRLAPLNDSISGSAEDGSDLPYVGYVAFVFACAVDGTLGPNDLSGHIYGTGQI